MEAAPKETLNHYQTLRFMTDYWFEIYQWSKRPDHLRVALDIARKAAEAAPKDGPDHYRTLKHLTSCLFQNFQLKKNSELLNELVDTARQAVEAAPKDAPDYHQCLYNLSICLKLTIQRTNNFNNLEEAIRITRQTISETPKDNPRRHEVLSNLSYLHHINYIQGQASDNLDVDILAAWRAVETPPENDPYLYRHLNKLLTYLSLQYNQNLDIGILQDLISTAQELVRTTRVGDPQRASRLQKLATFLYWRSSRTDDKDDIYETVRICYIAVEAVPENDPERPWILNNLIVSLNCQFRWTDNVDDLNNAVGFARQAIKTKDTNARARASILTNLSISLSLRSRRIGEPKDLHEAIEAAKMGLAETPKNDPKRPGRLSNLSVALYWRWSQTGDLDSLHESIRIDHEVASAISSAHPDGIHIMSNVSSRFMARYALTGDMKDLHEAVRIMSGLIARTPDRHPFKASLMNNLTLCEGQHGNIDDAINSSKQAIKHTSPSDPRLGSMLLSASSLLEKRYKGMGDRDNIDEAVEYAEIAFQIKPEGHPDRAVIQNQLARCLLLRSERIGDANDLTKAIECSLSAINYAPAPPLVRVCAGEIAVVELILQKRWSEAYAVLEKCISLFPTICQRSLTRESHEYILRNVSNLPPLAASVAFQCGLTGSRGLEHLELGRGVYAGLMLGLRGDLPWLHKIDSSLYDNYKDTRNFLDTALSRVDNRGQESDIVQRRLAAVRRLEMLEVDIRKLRVPGYERFPQPLTPEDYMNVASLHGPIVVFNSTLVRSDAVLVTGAGIHQINLPNLKYKDLLANLQAMFGNSEKKISPLVTGSLRTLSKRSVDTQRILQWLWDVAIEPVLKILGFLEPAKDGRLPRIWWIGCGSMSRLPFHAAGNHSKGSDQNTISKVISSYTPTLNAFARMRTKKLLRFDWSGSDVLVVAMPETPGQQDLNIEGEITSIKSHFPNAVIKTSPSKDEVMAALRVSKIAHFACHGETVVGDPSQSALLLKHPDKDQIQRLTVRDVSSINLEFGAIAYLSACSTAENSTPGLMDEFIHVANSFQLAGFAHVIGGLWPVQDRISVALTDRFYQLLNEVDDEEFVHDAVANAFHNAITFVRERNPTNVIAWAPFIHIGP